MVRDDLFAIGAVVTDGSRKPPPRTTGAVSIGDGDTAAVTCEADVVDMLKAEEIMVISLLGWEIRQH